MQYISHPKNTWYHLREDFPEVYENAVNPISKIVILAGKCRSTVPCIEYDDKITALEAFLNRLIKK